MPPKEISRQPSDKDEKQPPAPASSNAASSSASGSSASASNEMDIDQQLKKISDELKELRNRLNSSHLNLIKSYRFYNGGPRVWTNTACAHVGQAISSYVGQAIGHESISDKDRGNLTKIRNQLSNLVDAVAKLPAKLTPAKPTLKRKRAPTRSSQGADQRVKQARTESYTSAPSPSPLPLSQYPAFWFFPPVGSYPAQNHPIQSYPVQNYEDGLLLPSDPYSLPQKLSQAPLPQEAIPQEPLLPPDTSLLQELAAVATQASNQASQDSNAAPTSNSSSANTAPLLPPRPA